MSINEPFSHQAAPRLTTSVAAPRWFQQVMENPGQSGFFLCDGIPIHYLSWVEDNLEKPALIFVHGFRGHARWWDFIAPFFSDRYQVYAIDLSGKGDSGHRSTYTCDTHQQEVLGLIDHLELGSATLVGHSFGGSRVLRAAAAEPEKVDRVIAIDAHVFFSGDTVMDDPAAQTGQRFYPSLDAGLARFRLAPDQEIKEPYVMDYIGRNSLKRQGDSWTWKFDPAMDGQDFMTFDGDIVLSKITCPLDFVYGESSLLVNRKMGKRVMHYAVKPGKLIEIPGAHHHIMISHPEALIATLLALL